MQKIPSYKSNIFGSFIQMDLYQNNDLQREMSQLRSINDDVCLYQRPPSTLELKVKVILPCINKKTGLVTCRLQFKNSFQIAYDELFFDSVGRDNSKAWNNIKRVFVHVQVAYCHASLGTKVHINYGDSAILVNNRVEYEHTKKYKNDVTKPILEPLTEGEMEKDSSLNLLVFLTNKMGAGHATLNAICGELKSRWSINQCGDTDNVKGMLYCAAVSIIYNSLNNYFS